MGCYPIRFGGDPCNIRTLARLQREQGGRDGGFAETLVLGRKLFEDRIEGEGLLVGHGDADGAERCAVGSEEGHDGDPGLGIGDQGGRVKGNSNRWIFKNPIECVRTVLFGSERNGCLNLVANGRCRAVERYHESTAVRIITFKVLDYARLAVCGSRITKKWS